MRVETKGRFKHVTLEPGEYYASGEPVTISTLLGSCVSACLYDPASNIIGMNHFLLSHERYSRTLPCLASEAGRYGIQAMDLLIEEMVRLGARRTRLMAKVFGGATILRQEGNVGNFLCVGEVNCRFIEEYLAKERITIIARELGGNKGRVIHFSNGDFTVYVRKVEKGTSEKLAQRDRVCWMKSIEIQKLALTAKARRAARKGELGAAAFGDEDHTDRD